MAELTAPWRSRPRLPESPLGRNVIHRQAAPVAKGGERRGERGQEGKGRGSSQSGAVHRVALPSSRNRRHHSMRRPSPRQRGALLDTPGAVRSLKPGRARSHCAQHAPPSPTQESLRGSRSKCSEEEERGEGGRGSGRSPRRRAAVGFQAPAGHALQCGSLTHNVGSQRLSVDSTIREPGRTSNVSNTVNGRPGTSACTLLRTVHELSALCTELVLSHAPFRAHYAGPDATPKTGLGQAAPGKAVLPALPRCFVRADTP